MEFNEKKAQIIDEFSQLSDCFDRLSCLIAHAAQLPPPPDWLLQDGNLVSGCQSKVWIKGTLREGRVQINAYSDTLLIRGLLALLKALFDGETAACVLQENLAFLNASGLQSLLPNSRRQGLQATLDQLHEDLRNALQVTV